MGEETAVQEKVEVETVVVTRDNLASANQAVGNEDVQQNMFIETLDMRRAEKIIFRDGEFEKVLRAPAEEPPAEEPEK